jgi:hypothetical protein
LVYFLLHLLIFSCCLQVCVHLWFVSIHWNFTLSGSGGTSLPAGEGRAYLFSHLSITPVIKNSNDQLSSAHVFRYVDHVDDIGCLAYPVHHGFAHADLSLTDVVPHISKKMVQKIACIHKIPLSMHWCFTTDELVKVFEGHNCINCNLYTSVLEAQLFAPAKKKTVFSKLTEEQKIERNIKKHKPLKHGKAEESTVAPPPIFLLYQ